LATTAHDVLEFWFDELGQEKWFAPASEELDRLIVDRLGLLYAQAAAGSLNDWQESAKGAVALCLLLDQAPRNMFRGSPQAFATDDKALAVARRSIERGFHTSDVLNDFERIFLYMPFEHAENLDDQKLCVALLSALENDDEDWAKYALEHQNLIEQFGRFPHRNRVLGRPCTQAERIFLRGGNDGFGQGGPGAVFGVDHILVATADLDKAAALWTSLGFTVSQRGLHEGWPTANHCIMFGDHYVELIGLVGPGTAPPGLDEAIAANSGICGIAFAAPDGEKAAAHLTELGIAVEPVAHLSRQATGSVSDKRVSFELVRPRQSTAFGLPSFVCVHNSRDLVWQPELLSHANGATEVTGLSASIPTDDDLLGRYRSLVGELCAEPTPDGIRADLWGIELQAGLGRSPVITVRVDGSADPAALARQAGLDPISSEAGVEIQVDTVTLRFLKAG